METPDKQQQTPKPDEKTQKAQMLAMAFRQMMQEEEIQKTELEELAKKYDLTPQQQHQITAEELIPMNEEMTSKLTPEQQQWIAEFRKELKPYCDPKTLELMVRRALMNVNYWMREDWNPSIQTPAELAELFLM